MTWFRTTGLRLLLAFGLAFSLWLYVTYRENPTRPTPFKDVPVQIDNLAPELVVVDQNGLPTEPQHVTVTVEADANTLATVTASSFETFLDMAGRSEGDYVVPVDVRATRSDVRRVTFTSDPPSLPVRVEQLITRTVALTVMTSGSVPFSFEQLQPTIQFNEQSISAVRISGPRSQVAQVVATRATANIDRLTANYNSPRPVEPVDANGQIVRGVTITPPTVQVLVPIVSSVGIKRVPVVPEVSGQPASGQIISAITVDPEFVALTGSSGSLDAVERIATEVVDVGGMNGKVTRVVKLIPPQGAALIAGEPITASVTVSSLPIEQPFSVTLPAEVVGSNLPPGLLVNISPSSVQVTVRGTAAQLASLGGTALQGIVDLSNLGAGTYLLTPQFNLPRGTTITNAPRVTIALRLPPTPLPSNTPTPTPVESSAGTPGEAPTSAATAQPATPPLVTPATPAAATAEPAVVPTAQPTTPAAPPTGQPLPTASS